MSGERGPQKCHSPGFASCEKAARAQNTPPKPPPTPMAPEIAAKDYAKGQRHQKAPPKTPTAIASAAKDSAKARQDPPKTPPAPESAVKDSDSARKRRQRPLLRDLQSRARHWSQSRAMTSKPPPRAKEPRQATPKAATKAKESGTSTWMFRYQNIDRPDPV